MRIDQTIFAAIDAGTLTIAEALAAIARTLPEVERVALEAAAADAIAQGFAASDVATVTEKTARRLREGRADRLAAMRQRLEAGSTYLQ